MSTTAGDETPMPPVRETVADPAPDASSADSAPPRGAPGRQVAKLALLSIVLGVVAGVLWVLLAPRPAFLAGPSGLYYRSSLPSEYVAMDGWFAALTALAGLVVAVVVLRRTDPGARAVLAVALTGVLGSLVAWGTGHVLYPDNPTFVGSQVIGVVKFGAMTITAKGVLATWPVVSLAVLIFALAWKNPPALEPAEPALESVGRDRQMGEVGPRE